MIQIVARKVSMRTASGAFVCAVAFSASALAGLSDVVFDLQATNDTGAGQFKAMFTDGSFDSAANVFSWTLSGPVDVTNPSSGLTVATLNSGSLSVAGGSQIDLRFNVTAGGSDTVFTVGSAVASFLTIPPDIAAARASAAVRVTDLTGDSAMLTGVGTPGTGAFLAGYNGSGMFTNLVALVFAGANATGTGTQADPAFGTRPVGASVDDIWSNTNFSLTANDEADISSTYMVVPEPASIVSLLMLGALLPLRRRGAN